jgi:hypothetical protein
VRVRRRAKVRREGFTAALRAQLLDSRDMFRDGYGAGAALDVDAAARDWADHRDELLAFWLQDPPRWRRQHQPALLDPPPGGAGSRPWGWWAFDAPQTLRRVLEGTVAWLPIEDWPRQTSFGRPTRFEAVPERMRWEAEALYLLRHGALTDTERRQLGMAATPPRARRNGKAT